MYLISLKRFGSKRPRQAMEIKFLLVNMTVILLGGLVLMLQMGKHVLVLDHQPVMIFLKLVVLV
ncbi:hypothetical protein BMS3Abin04_03080 [bacterium BMS3Abin04]|nr:hypothetical protein BMS3Abin04_03080 [bacterium BMS3Abin04]